MFGYVRVMSPELKVKEYEFYRGTYCGLCRSMGKCTGQCSRMTLSYDFAFLALVRLSVSGESVSFGQKRCMAHPLKKRNYMKHNPVLAYCAGAAALLNYHKVMDDLSDEKGFKRLRALAFRPFAAHSRKKAIKAGLSSLDEQIAARLALLSETEHTALVSADIPAAVFGDLLADIMSFGLAGSNERLTAALGKAVGKWIYLADALDDWTEDAKKGRYNPFLLLYDGASPTEDTLAGIRNALKNELYEAEAALDLMPFENPEIKNLVLNILYLGMPARIEQIQADSPKTCKSKKRMKERTDNR